MSHNDEGAKIFVGGIGETGDEELKNYFGQYGIVKAVHVKYDPNTQRARGFGFVIFDDMSTVDTVMSAVPHALPSGQKIDAKRIEVPQELFKIFIGGIPQGFTEEGMRDYFSRYGNIEVIEWPKGPQGPKNFCFIKFDSLAVVKEICKHSKHILGGQECDVKQCSPNQGQGGRGGGGDRGGFGDRGRGGFGDRGRGFGDRGRGRGDFGGGRGGDRSGSDSPKYDGDRGGRGGRGSFDRGGRGGRGGFQNGSSDRGGFRGGRGGDRGGRGSFDRGGRGGDRGSRGGFGMGGRGSPRGAPRGAPAAGFNGVQYGQPQQLVPQMTAPPAAAVPTAPPAAANPYAAYQDPNAYAAAYGQTYDYSQHAHLAAAQPAVQPIQAAQPVPQAAMPPQAQPQYDYSAYAGYAHAQQAAQVPAAAAAAAAAAVAHQPSPIPGTGYNAYGQPLQAAPAAQPAPANGYHQPQPAVSAYQQYDQSAYAGYAAYQ